MDILSAVASGLSNPMVLILLFGSFILLALLDTRLDLRDMVRQKSSRSFTPQYEALGTEGFKRQSLMNKTEFRVFATVERVIARSNSGYRVMAQISLGEVLRTEQPSSVPAARKAYSVINCKRLDMAIIDRSGFVALAIEVQGGGHYQGADTFIRDAVKKEALRRAGIDLLEVTPDWDAARIAHEVHQRLALKVAA